MCKSGKVREVNARMSRKADDREWKINQLLLADLEEKLSVGGKKI